MSTWGSLLSDIRADLKDTSATKRWPDSSLYVWAKDAIRDYSVHFPLRKSTTLTESDGKYALPDDFANDLYVTCPDDEYLEKRQTRPGVKYLTVHRPTLYSIREGFLYLNGSPSVGDEVTLFYEAKHDVPASETDTTFVLTIPEADEELIRLYVKAKATEQVRTQQSNLDRFSPGSGRRDDNPLEPETVNLMGEYYRKIAQRFPGGVIYLYRPDGRYR